MEIEIINAVLGCLFCGVWIMVGQIVFSERANDDVATGLTDATRPIVKL